MTELDNMIRKALDEEDRKLFDNLDSDMGLVDMTTSIFKGRRRWLTIMAFFYSLVAFGLAIWCAFQFFDAEGLKATVAWATGFLSFMLMVSMLKIWVWQEMQRAGILREIKRVELQIASLSAIVAKRDKD